MREQRGPLLSPTDPVLHPPDHRHPAPLSDVHGEGDPGAVEDCQTVSSRHVESSPLSSPRNACKINEILSPPVETPPRIKLV